LFSIQNFTHGLRRGLHSFAASRLTLAGPGDFLQRFFEIVWFEAEWTRLALVRDSVVLIDKIDAIGPAGVGGLSCVIESVDHCGEFDSKFAHAGSSNIRTLVEIFRTRENDLVFEIALGLPDVAGVCLDNVDDQKGDSITVLIVELVEGGNLPPEGRSSVAAEDEHDGLTCGESRELHRCGFVELDQ